MSNINELYRTIIIRNNKIKRLKKLRKKSIIYLEMLEKTNLQQNIDLLLNYHSSNEKNSNFNTAVKKSYFKQYLLGKRVNFSGRSVITSGPVISYSHLGIPFLLALKLFEFKLLQFMKQHTSIKTFLALSYYISYNSLILKRLLRFILRKEIVLVNRAPTLHRMNIQSFKPYLVEGNAIKLSPLVCSGFNADFDGDQMGIFLLISNSAAKESKKMLFSDKNILHPTLSKNTFKYSQSIVLGLNTLLSLRLKEKSCLIFSSLEEVFNAYSHGILELNTVFFLKVSKSDNITLTKDKTYITTSVGRLLIQNII